MIEHHKECVTQEMRTLYPDAKWAYSYPIRSWVLTVGVRYLWKRAVPIEEGKEALELAEIRFLGGV